MEQKIYLIRHGHTPGTDRNLMYGGTELPVTEEGLRKIRRMAKAGVYPDAEGAELYTSGMLRTEQTFAEIYGDIEHRTAPLLKEIHIGQFEMQSIEEILADDYGRAWLEGRLEDPSFEGGDSFSGFFARTREGITEIVEEAVKKGTSRVILVIHGAVISSIMDFFFPGRFKDPFRWVPTPGCGYEIVMNDGKPVSWTLFGRGTSGSVPHLKEKAGQGSEE